MTEPLFIICLLLLANLVAMYLRLRKRDATIRKLRKDLDNADRLWNDLVEVCEQKNFIIESQKIRLDRQ
jgi:hypothetical protein